jgi:FtsP/CotA-like multicopper oxidase with cupredoxin domain
LSLSKQNPESKTRSQIPKTRFSVKWGSRYRFRIINAASLDCPIQLQVEGHTLIIIASDGAPVKPTATSHLLLFPGIDHITTNTTTITTTIIIIIIIIIINKYINLT